MSRGNVYCFLVEQGATGERKAKEEERHELGEATATIFHSQTL
jgi:hypothetical protein